MRPFLPYNILLALTVLCCGACVLYNTVFRAGYATTLRYHYPPVAQQPEAAAPQPAPPGRFSPQDADDADNIPTGGERETITEVRFPLELNAATEEELKFIPQVGDVMAQRIVQYREQLGGYTALEQLTEISGVGEKTFEHLETYLYIAGPEDALAG